MVVPAKSEANLAWVIILAPVSCGITVSCYPGSDLQNKNAAHRRRTKEPGKRGLLHDFSAGNGGALPVKARSREYSYLVMPIGITELDPGL